MIAGYLWRAFLPMKTIRPEVDGLPSTIFFDRGIARDFDGVMLLYGKYKCSYAKAGFVSVEEACRAIHQAGGFAVLAHPGYSIKGDRGLYVAQIRRLFTCDLMELNVYIHCIPPGRPRMP